VRIGQIAGAGVPDPQHRVVLEEALKLFDQAALIRLSDANLGGLPASLADQVRRTLASRNGQSIRQVAADIEEAAPATSRALEVAGLVMEEKAS
jgi:hypothetical protein